MRNPRLIFARPVFADGPLYPALRPPVEKKTVQAVAAVAHAVPVPAHSQGLSLGASAGILNLQSRNKGSSTMVIPIGRYLKIKTPPIAQQRVPSVGGVRKRMFQGTSAHACSITASSAISAKRRIGSTTLGPRRRRSTRTNLCFFHQDYLFVEHRRTTW